MLNADSVINIVPNELPLEFDVTRDDMDVPNEELFQSVKNEFLSIYTMNSIADCLIKAKKNGAHGFSVLPSSTNTHCIPKSNLRKMEEEIKGKFSNFVCTKDIQYIAGLFSTQIT